MIISVINQKGGVGKTTLTVNLAGAMALTGARVLVLDADHQGSALDWVAARQTPPLFPVVGLPKHTIHRDLPALSVGFDHVVIDGPPRVAEVTRSAMMASDFVLIPVQPSPYDVWAAAEVVKLLREAAAFKEKLKSAFVINRKIANTAIGRDVQEALAGFELPVLKATLSQRVIFAESASQGLTVLEAAPDSAAAQEVRELFAEIRGLA